MKLFAYSLLDTKTGMFNTPFFCAHRGQAIRYVTDIAGDSNTTIGRHPADFALCELGSWDDGNGAFENQIPLNLGLAAAYIEPRAQQGFNFAAPPDTTSHEFRNNGDAS